MILISRYADDVHLDIDAVLLGELAFAPFDRIEFWGWDWGPTALVVMGAILVLNVVAITVFWKELKRRRSTWHSPSRSASRLRPSSTR